MSSSAVLEAKEFTDLQRRHHAEPGIVDQALVFGLCALLIFAVLAFGAVEAWSTFTFEAGAVAVFVVWAGKQLLASQVTLSKNPLYLPVLLFLGLIFLQIAFRRSAYTYVTKYEALQYVSYGIVFLVAVEAIRGADARKKFALVMTVFGTLYAWFALAQDLTSNGKLFWVRTPQFGGSMYGSYVNRDHYAGLMEMLVPIPLVLSMGHLFKGAQRILVGFCAVLMASTIFLSGSRGGMLAFFVEMVLLGALMFRKKRSPRAVLGYVAVCVFIAALICFSSKGQVLGRFGDLSPGMRLHISKDSLRMFAKRPLYGWGLGTFPTVYPRYRSFHTNLFVNEAHNDYAQLLAETGLLGFSLMMWFLILLYQRGLTTSRRWERRWDGAVALAALMGCTGILLHSLVDFNLHIPANAALFYVLCALAASEPLAESSSRRRTRATGTKEILEPSGSA